MILIAGLGNPGPSYAGHRHNIGFMALDRIARAEAFPAWRAKFQGETTDGRIGSKRVILLKPMTYMNESGRAVAEAARFLKVPLADVIVIHDELDLAPGRCRVKLGGGHAGHNGLRSIHAHLGPDYARIRVGIGHPGHKDAVSGHVLHDFSKAELELVEPVLDGIVDGVAKLVAGDDAGFQNAVALRAKPPKKARPPGEKPPHQARAAAKKVDDARAKADKALEGKPENPLARLLARFSR
ncbi:MAG TPA: aminoacyl-tRNA hydrolase [Paracoccaceae bacterium]|nr:aminoacyl-tRNA hydrolase [Paracoccaceae bacterium]